MVVATVLLLLLLLPPTGGPAASVLVSAPGSAPVARPVDGPVVRAYAPPATRYGAGHRGVDLAAPAGTPVRAALAGTVRFSGLVGGAGWVTVDHGGGLQTTYGHLDPRGVAPGQRVAAGALLGRVAVGRAHLDWGARLHGDYTDPMALLGRWEIHLTA
jgi:murein DD-endopeptidase MepM/ murein hydrolase activator NlpD